MSDGVLRVIKCEAKFIKSAVKLNFSVIGFEDKNLEQFSKMSKENAESK